MFHGTDCHGTPITERARKEGKTPNEIAEYYHNEFVETFNKMNFSYDLYSRKLNVPNKCSRLTTAKTRMIKMGAAIFLFIFFRVFFIYFLYFLPFIVHYLYIFH